MAEKRAISRSARVLAMRPRLLVDPLVEVAPDHRRDELLQRAGAEHRQQVL
jgi:hypothetical protein